MQKKSQKKIADVEDTEEEEEIVKKTSKKPIKRDDETEAVAIIYQIESEKHPFHYLNGVPDSVEISKLDCPRTEVYKVYLYFIINLNRLFYSFNFKVKKK